MENVDFCLKTADKLASIFSKFNVPYIYKSSFDKANRSDLSSFRGVGLSQGLKVLSLIKEKIGVPVITDVHTPEQAIELAPIVDIIQIPAFLCRQTDLILAASATQKPLNIKKGQFISPQEMSKILTKTLSTGNTRILLCERGFMFGYEGVVADMRSLSIMSKTGYPVVFDASHSVQMSCRSCVSGSNQREFIPVLAKAATATGIAAIYFETHPHPDKALCDGNCMIPFNKLPNIIQQIKLIDDLVKNF